jgi:hypothetical protein
MWKKKHPAEAREVLVSLLSGRAVRGVLWQSAGDYILLRSCTLYEKGVEPTPCDGEVLLDKANVEYIQIV